MTVNQLLVSRLEPLWDPLAALELTVADIADLSAVTPLAEHSGQRSKAYHLGRIAYFVEVLKKGCELDPIDVDNQCGDGVIYPEPIVFDGNHRFIAYVLMGRKKIPANYGGRVDLLRYLEGKRKNLPVD